MWLFSSTTLFAYAAGLSDRQEYFNNCKPARVATTEVGLHISLSDDDYVSCNLYMEDLWHGAFYGGALPEKPSCKDAAIQSMRDFNHNCGIEYANTQPTQAPPNSDCPAPPAVPHITPKTPRPTAS